MNSIKRSLSGMAMSLVELIIGILLLVNPVVFTSGIIVAFGVVLMLMGIGSMIKYFRTEPEEAAVNQSEPSPGIAPFVVFLFLFRCCTRHVSKLQIELQRHPSDGWYCGRVV